MPIYEFACPQCGERFEELVPAGTQRVTCRACGEAATERLISPPADVPRLVKTPRENRRLEEKRGIAREGSKQRFKESLRRAREARPPHQKRGAG